MNEVLKTIRDRRSIRKYKPGQIADGQLSAILEAGVYAPSACNQQSWKFAVIQNRVLMRKTVDMAKKALKSEDSPFYGAPTVVMVFGDSAAVAPVTDASLAMQNMMLAAASLGLGSCCVFCANEIFKTPEGDALKKELGVPEGYRIVGSVILGLPDETPAAPERKEGTVLLLK